MLKESDTIINSTEDESIFYSGYMERRSKWFKMWTVRWFVLHGRILHSYTDKTLTNERGQLVLSPSTSIEALPHEGSRKFIFSVREDTGRSWILSAEDFSSQELWMIQVIQAARGAFATSENFETGVNWDNISQSDSVLPNTIISCNNVHNGPFSCDGKEEEDSFFHIEKSPDSKITTLLTESSHYVMGSPPISKSNRNSTLRS